MEYIALNHETKAPLRGIGAFMMSPADAEEAPHENSITARRKFRRAVMLFLPGRRAQDPSQFVAAPSA